MEEIISLNDFYNIIILIRIISKIFAGIDVNDKNYFEKIKNVLEEAHKNKKNIYKKSIETLH